MCIGEDLEKRQISHITGGIIKWYNHFGEKFDSFLRI